MPNYDFKCEDCGYKFSKMVSYEKRNEVSCKECGSDKTKQIFTSIMVQGGSGSSSGGGSGCGTCTGGSCC